MKHLVDIAERATATAAQAALGVIGANYAGVLDLDWVNVGSVAGLAALLSVLKSVVASGFGRGTPSLVDQLTED